MQRTIDEKMQNKCQGYSMITKKEYNDRQNTRLSREKSLKTNPEPSLGIQRLVEKNCVTVSDYLEKTVLCTFVVCLPELNRKEKEDFNEFINNLAEKGLDIEITKTSSFGLFRSRVDVILYTMKEIVAK